MRPKFGYMIKWIAAVVGYLGFGFRGAIGGFILGSLLELIVRKSGVQFQASSGNARGGASPGDFEIHLLSLCSIVIKADGKVSQRELDYVRHYFVQAYGKERANAAFRTFNDVIRNRKVQASNICAHLYSRTSYEVRLQILHFLFGIAQADGHVSEAEARELGRIAGFLRLARQDFESIKAMFFKSADEAYKILDVDKNATDKEVKKAYRKMVKKYHPDKLTHMDEAYRKGAREKFNKVQEAYEKIQKERGM